MQLTRIKVFHVDMGGVASVALNRSHDVFGSHRPVGLELKTKASATISRNVLQRNKFFMVVRHLKRQTCKVIHLGPHCHAARNPKAAKNADSKKGYLAIALLFGLEKESFDVGHIFFIGPIAVKLRSMAS